MEPENCKITCSRQFPSELGGRGGEETVKAQSGPCEVGSLIGRQKLLLATIKCLKWHGLAPSHGMTSCPIHHARYC